MSSVFVGNSKPPDRKVSNTNHSLNVLRLFHRLNPSLLFIDKQQLGVKASSIEFLLNPCKCSEAKFCACCRPMFTEYLSKNYPSQVVEETANTFKQQLIQPIARTVAEEPAATVQECPQGPRAPCCQPNGNGKVASHGTADGKPNCSCGCDCRKKLDMLVQAIESRIGVSVPAAAIDSPVSLENSEEWVESILNPLAQSIVTSQPQRLTFAGGVRLAQEEETNGGGGCCSDKTETCCSKPRDPFQKTATNGGCCSTTVNAKQSNGPMSDGCCGGKCNCSCSKKRKRLWQPGDPNNPEIDKDGALACSCGCHKPFEECRDCFEDLCEDVLLESNF